MRFFAGVDLRFLPALLLRPPFFRLASVLAFGRPIIQLPDGADGARDWCDKGGFSSQGRTTLPTRITVTPDRTDMSHR